jgi:hypothetical protein
MPAAAMLTEQNPPCAAKFGVPNWAAQYPVNAWLWSRPVKKASFFRVGGADRRQPLDRGRERLVPFDLAEHAGAALADPFQGLAQFGRRLLLHDARGALAADHPAIDRVIAVALDVADAAILQMDFDAAATGAHVAGCAFDLVRHLGRRVDDLARREIIAEPLGEAHPRWRVRGAGQRILLRRHALVLFCSTPFAGR